MDIVLHPDKKLRKPTETMTHIPSAEFIEEMRQFMILKRGVGLAANQIGITDSFFIANFSFGFEVCVNPEIIQTGREIMESPEGCLSILDEKGRFIFKPKKRNAVITVTYTAMSGALLKKTLKRLDAKIFQHEMDHLAGRLCQD